MGSLTFNQFSFVLSGSQLDVRRRQDAEMGEILFQGTVEELHEPPNRDLHNRLDEMEVISVDADGGVLLIGVDEI